MFTLRFDMRAPAGGAPASSLYPAALDMAAWAESRGLILLVVSEHHAAEDGMEIGLGGELFQDGTAILAKRHGRLVAGRLNAKTKHAA